MSNCGVSSSIVYSGDWTVTAWVYPVGFPGSDNDLWSTAVVDGFDLGPVHEGFSVSGSPFLQSSMSFASNTWYFLGLSKSQGTNYQLYLNGATNSSSVMGNSSLSYFEIGNNLYSQYIDGAVADFRVYGRVLSTNEVATLAANGPDAVALRTMTAPTGLRVISPGH